LHRLKRDDRPEKSAAQLAMEADLAKKKLLDAPYEDVTEVNQSPKYIYLAFY
jgi:hypothetical protein